MRKKANKLRELAKKKQSERAKKKQSERAKKKQHEQLMKRNKKKEQLGKHHAWLKAAEVLVKQTTKKQTKGQEITNKNALKNAVNTGVGNLAKTSLKRIRSA